MHFLYLKVAIYFYRRECRDQGLTRPKVLILVPFRDAALRVINLLIQLALPIDEKVFIIIPSKKAVIFETVFPIDSLMAIESICTGNQNLEFFIKMNFLFVMYFYGNRLRLYPWSVNC